MWPEPQKGHLSQDLLLHPQSALDLPWDNHSLFPKNLGLGLKKPAVSVGVWAQSTRQPRHNGDGHFCLSREGSIPQMEEHGQELWL